MKIIEPCCAPRHLKELRNAIRNGGTAEFRGYGDMSLTELLPAMLTWYDDVEMLIAAPSMPEQATEIIARWMKVQWPRMDGRGKVPAIRHLTIVADLSIWKSPAASQWLKENPFGDRLTLVDRQQEDTAILLPDFAITGPVNMRYGNPFTATATTDPDAVAALWAKYARPSEPENTVAEEPTEAPEKPDVPEKPESTAVPEPKRKTSRKTKEAPVGPAVQEEVSEDAAL